MTFEPTGLDIYGNPSLQEAGNLLRQLQLAGKSVAMWIGDLLNYMDSRWGETYTQFIEETGYSYSRLADMKYTMAHVPRQNRFEELSFEHFSAVASLRPHEQKPLLERARDQGWSGAETRRQKRVRQSPGNPGAYSVKHAKRVVRAFLKVSRLLQNAEIVHGDSNYYKRKLRQRDKFGMWLEQWSGLHE